MISFKFGEMFTSFLKYSVEKIINYFFFVWIELQRRTNNLEKQKFSGLGLAESNMHGGWLLLLVDFTQNHIALGYLKLLINLVIYRPYKFNWSGLD